MTDPQKDGILDQPWVTVIVIALVILGAVDVVIDGHLSADFRTYVDTIAVPLAGLALGRGWAARKPG